MRDIVYVKDVVDVRFSSTFTDLDSGVKEYASLIYQ